MPQLVYEGSHEVIEFPKFGLRVERGETVEVKASIAEALVEFGFELVKPTAKKKETADNG